MGKTAGILTVQFNPILGEKSANLEKVQEILSQYCDKELDLVIVPEFFSTGICQKAFVGAPENTEGGIVVEKLSQMAKRYNTNIVCGSVIIKEGDKLYNTSFVLNREGKIVGEYRKIHLFKFFGGNEHSYTTAGETPLVVQLDFARVGVSLCFDIKYPMLYKKLIQQGAEIIVSPSAWCKLTAMSEKDKADFASTWRAMNICRAAESLVYFVTSNLTGLTNEALFCMGHSMIVNPMGAVEIDAGVEEGGFYKEINLQLVRELKSSVPVALLE